MISHLPPNTHCQQQPEAAIHEAGTASRKRGNSLAKWRALERMRNSTANAPCGVSSPACHFNTKEKGGAAALLDEGLSIRETDERRQSALTETLSSALTFLRFCHFEHTEQAQRAALTSKAIDKTVQYDFFLEKC
jgi:hypothetical protein